MEAREMNEKVHELAKLCLFREEELQGLEPGVAPEGALLVEGVRTRMGFHGGRIQEAKPQIREILSQLPDEFWASKGGGMSFLNACMNRNGEHWAEHPTIDSLICLGLAAGLVEFQLPREIWGALPGGVPYFSFKDN